jgi:hypothetical protein
MQATWRILQNEVEAVMQNPNYTVPASLSVVRQHMYRQRAQRKRTFDEASSKEARGEDDEWGAAPPSPQDAAAGQQGDGQEGPGAGAPVSGEVVGAAPLMPRRGRRRHAVQGWLQAQGQAESHSASASVSVVGLGPLLASMSGATEGDGAGGGGDTTSTQVLSGPGSMDGGADLTALLDHESLLVTIAEAATAAAAAADFGTGLQLATASGSCSPLPIHQGILSMQEAYQPQQGSAEPDHQPEAPSSQGTTHPLAPTSIKPQLKGGPAVYLDLNPPAAHQRQQQAHVQAMPTWLLDSAASVQALPGALPSHSQSAKAGPSSGDASLVPSSNTSSSVMQHSDILAGARAAYLHERSQERLLRREALQRVVSAASASKLPYYKMRDAAMNAPPCTGAPQASHTAGDAQQPPGGKSASLATSAPCLCLTAQLPPRPDLLPNVE